MISTPPCPLPSPLVATNLTALESVASRTSVDDDLDVRKVSSPRSVSLLIGTLNRERAQSLSSASMTAWCNRAFCRLSGRMLNKVLDRSEARRRRSRCVTASCQLRGRKSGVEVEDARAEAAEKKAARRVEAPGGVGGRGA